MSSDSTSDRSRQAGGTRESPKQRLIGELATEFRVASTHEQAFDTLAAAELGINRTDLNCLDILQRLGPITAGELATESGLSTGAVTAVVDRLEEAGYARRTRDAADRRKVVVEITPEFLAAAAEIWGPATAEWNAYMAKFTTAQLRVIREFMRGANEVHRRLIARLRARRDGGAP